MPKSSPNSQATRPQISMHIRLSLLGRPVPPADVPAPDAARAAYSARPRQGQGECGRACRGPQTPAYRLLPTGSSWCSPAKTGAGRRQALAARRSGLRQRLPPIPWGRDHPHHRWLDRRSLERDTSGGRSYHSAPCGLQGSRAKSDGWWTWRMRRGRSMRHGPGPRGRRGSTNCGPAGSA